MPYPLSSAFYMPLDFKYVFLGRVGTGGRMDFTVLKLTSTGHYGI